MFYSSSSSYALLSSTYAVSDAGGKTTTRPHSTTAMPTIYEQDRLSVRATLVYGGYLACAVSAAFSIILVLLTPGPLDPTSHALRYISDGMFAHCGLATAVLGPCALLLFACQLIAAAHMEHPSALFCATTQAVGWNVVLGVADTGWPIHYVGLAVFLVATVAYHWCASHDAAYGGPWYRWTTYAASSVMVLFGALATAAICLRGEPAVQTAAVAVEFAMMLAISAENMCLVNALDQFDDIHLQFCARRAYQSSSAWSV